MPYGRLLTSAKRDEVIGTVGVSCMNAQRLIRNRVTTTQDAPTEPPKASAKHAAKPDRQPLRRDWTSAAEMAGAARFRAAENRVYRQHDRTMTTQLARDLCWHNFDRCYRMIASVLQA